MVRFVGRVLGAAAVLAFALVGCSAAPEDADSSSNALLIGGIGGGSGGGGVVSGCTAPDSSYWYPYVTSTRSYCSILGISLGTTRQLDTTNGFESLLAANGCNTTIDVLSGHWNITSCPDTCNIRQIAAAWANTAPVYSQITHESPGTCFPANPNGLWMIWDPNCPSTCLVMKNGGT